MEKIIRAFSLYQAFQYLLKELKEEGEENLPPSFINIDKIVPMKGSNRNEELHDNLIECFKGSGTIAGYEIAEPGDNPNQVQTQVIDTDYPPGDKKWKGIYLAVFDNPRGDQTVPGSRSNTKKECVDITRGISSSENRDAFVIMGKVPVGFTRCTAQVLYKPSPKQRPGEYCFIW